MQFSTSALLLIVTLTSFPSHSEATVFQFLFDLLLRPLVNPACMAVQEALNLTSTFKCGCDLGYLGLFRGFAGDIECQNKETFCVAPSVCGSASLGFDFNAGVFVPTGLDGDINAIFNVTAGIPPIARVNTSLAFRFGTKGLGLSDCAVKIGNESCSACTVCSPNAAFNFSCSNIILFDDPLNITTLRGPAFSDCIGLSGL